MKQEQTFIIINRLGLHARAAAKFVTTASEFNSSIHISRDNRRVNGKSIMGVMMLAAAKGTEVCITAEGDDADVALRTIGELIANYFGEGQ